jgi:predicted transcriptional regulator
VEDLEKTTLNITRNSRLGLLAILQQKCVKPKTKAEMFWSSSGKFSYNSLNRVLTQALKLGLLKKVGSKYKTTGKGLEYCKRFEELLKFLEREEQTR